MNEERRKSIKHSMKKISELWKKYPEEVIACFALRIAKEQEMLNEMIKSDSKLKNRIEKIISDNRKA